MLLTSLILDYLEHLEIEQGRSLLTVRNYARYLEHFTDWLRRKTPNPSIADLTHESIRHYRLSLSRSKKKDGSYLKKATINYYLIAIRNLLKYAQKNDIPALAPEKIELARQTRPQVSVLSLEKLELILKAASPQGPDDLPRLRDYAILETLFSTGLRVSELASLNRDQVNTSRREFVVRGKGSKDRVVFLSVQAAEHLAWYLNKRTDSYPPVFIRLQGSPPSDDPHGLSMRLSSRSIERIVNKYAKQAGLVEHITPHTLRHTFATDLLSSGADLRSVQEMLGHSNIQTTQVYTHVTNKQLREVHQAFHARRRRNS